MNQEKTRLLVKEELNKRFRLKSTLIEISQGTVMGLLIGSVFAPLALNGPDQMLVTLSSIVGSVGANLIANWVQRFYDFEIKEEKRVSQDDMDYLYANPDLKSNVFRVVQEMGAVEELQKMQDLWREIAPRLDPELTQLTVGNENVQVTQALGDKQISIGDGNVQIAGKGIKIKRGNEEFKS